MAFVVAGLVNISSAVSVDIVPDTLNVFNTTGNYVTAYVEQDVIFKDDFSDPAWTEQNWQVLNGLWTVEDEQYVGEGTVSTRDISLAGAMISPVEATNFILTVKLRHIAFGDSDGYNHYQGAIIPFRFSLQSPVTNSYMAALIFFEDGVRLQFRTSGGWTGHAPNGVAPFDPYPMEIGYTEHQVKIVACGSSYRIFVDDMTNPVIEKTFPSTILGARLGLWAYKNAEVYFDDFLVTECFDPSTVDVSSVKLWRSWTDEDGPHLDFIASAVDEPTSAGDHDCDGLPDLMVKFDRATVAQYLRDHNILSGEVDLVVTGNTDDGCTFSGSDSVKVISKGKLKL